MRADIYLTCKSCKYKLPNDKQYVFDLKNLKKTVNNNFMNFMKNLVFGKEYIWDITKIKTIVDNNFFTNFHYDHNCNECNKLIKKFKYPQSPVLNQTVNNYACIGKFGFYVIDEIQEQIVIHKITQKDFDLVRNVEKFNTQGNEVTKDKFLNSIKENCLIAVDCCIDNLKNELKELGFNLTYIGYVGEHGYTLYFAENK
jgi:hypothetical protein